MRLTPESDKSFYLLMHGSRISSQSDQRLDRLWHHHKQQEQEANQRHALNVSQTTLQRNAVSLTAFAANTRVGFSIALKRANRNPNILVVDTCAGWSACFPEHHAPSLSISAIAARASSRSRASTRSRVTPFAAGPVPLAKGSTIDAT